MLLTNSGILLIFLCFKTIFAQNFIVVGQDFASAVASFAIRRIVGNSANISLVTRHNTLDSRKIEEYEVLPDVDKHYSVLYGVKGGFVDFLGKELNLTPCTSSENLQQFKLWNGDKIMDINMNSELSEAGERIKRVIVDKFESFYNGLIMGTIQEESILMDFNDILQSEIQLNNKYSSLLGSESAKEFLGVSSSFFYHQSYESIHGFAALAAVTPFLSDSVCYLSSNITQMLIDYSMPSIYVGSPVSFINQTSEMSYNVHSWSNLYANQHAGIFTDDNDGVYSGFMMLQRDRFPFDRREHEAVNHFEKHTTLVCGSIKRDYLTPDSTMLLTALHPVYDVEFVSVRKLSSMSSCPNPSTSSLTVKTDNKRPVANRDIDVTPLGLYEIVSEGVLNDGALTDVFSIGFIVINRQIDTSRLLNLNIDSLKSAKNRHLCMVEGRYGANFIWGNVFNYLSSLDDFAIMSAFNAVQLSVQALGYHVNHLDRYVNNAKLTDSDAFDEIAMSDLSMANYANRKSMQILNEMKSKVDPVELEAFEEYKRIIMGGLDLEVDLLGGFNFSSVDFGEWSKHCPLSTSTLKEEKKKKKKVEALDL